MIICSVRNMWCHLFPSTNQSLSTCLVKMWLRLYIFTRPVIWFSEVWWGFEISSRNIFLRISMCLRLFKPFITDSRKLKENQQRFSARHEGVGDGYIL